MAVLEPDSPFGWHDGRASWGDIKAALMLGLAAVLGVILLF
jgi:hypothetical protein